MGPYIPLVATESPPKNNTQGFVSGGAQDAVISRCYDHSYKVHVVQTKLPDWMLGRGRWHFVADWAGACPCFCCWGKKAVVFTFVVADVVGFAAPPGLHRPQQQNSTPRPKRR